MKLTRKRQAWKRAGAVLLATLLTFGSLPEADYVVHAQEQTEASPESEETKAEPEETKAESEEKQTESEEKQTKSEEEQTESEEEQTESEEEQTRSEEEQTESEEEQTSSKEEQTESEEEQTESEEEQTRSEEEQTESEEKQTESEEEQTESEENDEKKSETAGIITAWEWIDEEDIIDPKTGNMALPFANKNCPAYFDDVVALLPTQILATVENTEDTEAEAASETITLGDWACEEYPKEGVYTGSYTFAAALPEGYVLSEEAEALTVLVELGGAQTYENAESVTVGAFTVTGGTKDTDYTYADGVLTIKTATAIMIANADSSTATTDRIEVESGISANITLAGVNINAEPAFKIADNSSGDVTITLADGSVNTLKSGYGCAGLQKNGEYSETLGKLTIQGNTGTLTATGGNRGAGIGGGENGTGSNITISGGTVTATSGSMSAGIGGGENGTGSNITISGGTVTATGGMYGAGIGGGINCDGSNITINGGTVTATGYGSAGIGGGYRGTGSNITISGGTVTATGGYHGAGIGGGSVGSGSNITISGGTVIAIGGKYGAGIGGGNSGIGSNIEISGGTVTATGGEGGAGIGGGYSGTGSDITISGGSVKAVAGTGANAIGGGSNQSAVIPTLADDTTSVYLLTIANPDSKEVFIDGVSYTPVNHKAVDQSDTNLYAYLTGEPHLVKVGEKTWLYMFNSDSNTFTAMPLTVYATNGGTLTYDTDYTYADGVLTIKTGTPVTIANTDPNTATTDRIEVADGVSANITLAGVNIDVSSSCETAAFKIADNSSGDVTITLADDSENTLKSGENCAGLQKNGAGDNIGKLTIQGGTNGTGKLTATSGGDYGRSRNRRRL